MSDVNGGSSDGKEESGGRLSRVRDYLLQLSYSTEKVRAARDDLFKMIDETKKRLLMEDKRIGEQLEALDRKNEDLAGLIEKVDSFLKKAESEMARVYALKERMEKAVADYRSKTQELDARIKEVTDVLKGLRRVDSEVRSFNARLDEYQKMLAEDAASFLNDAYSSIKSSMDKSLEEMRKKHSQLMEKYRRRVDREIGGMEGADGVGKDS